MGKKGDVNEKCARKCWRYSNLIKRVVVIGLDFLVLVPAYPMYILTARAAFEQSKYIVCDLRCVSLAGMRLRRVVVVGIGM